MFPTHDYMLLFALLAQCAVNSIRLGIPMSVLNGKRERMTIFTVHFQNNTGVGGEAAAESKETDRNNGENNSGDVHVC